MNNRQIRGLTGVAQKPDYVAMNTAKSATLPGLKSAEYTRQANEKALDLQSQSVQNEKDYYDAVEKDRQRGMIMQGGMLGVQGYNALNDMSGGVMNEAVSSGVKGLVGGSNTETIGSLGIGNPGAYGGSSATPGLLNEGVGYVADTAKDLGGWAMDNVISPIKDWVGTAYDAGADFVTSLWS